MPLFLEKSHFVYGWLAHETVCKSKCVGGLGVKKAAWMNQDLLAKFSWRLLQNDQGLWAKVLKCLPPDIVLMITSLHDGFIYGGFDMCIWSFLLRVRPSFGCFVIKSSLLMLKAFGSSGNGDGVVYFHWQALLPGSCKVSSDGSRKHALGFIEAGGSVKRS
ncbi:unnamed protein product [Prunus armeniaca]